MTNISLPFVNLSLKHSPFREEILASIEKVLDHGQFILGPEVAAFEERFAALCGTAHAVAVDNGTSALFLTLRALGIGSGDEVITVPNSFLASASAIALTGARPVFVDIRDDFTMDWSLLEAAISPRTRAILPVHLTGKPADMHPILELARRHKLHVIEDCAQAVGARYHGQAVGSFGAAGCFSLHPLKNLNALGDGGVITTNDPDLYAQLCKARNHGLRNRDECEFWSPNCRLDTLQAAILLTKMNHLAAHTERRREIARFYCDKLAGLVTVPQEQNFEYCVYHTFIIRTKRRDHLQRCLKSRGIDTKIHYPVPIHLQQAAKDLGYLPGSFPVAERQAAEILSLPIYPELTQQDAYSVVEAITACLASEDCP
jgi:dTDP-4-amino-4,6-dideoxygalactose transaminase